MQILQATNNSKYFPKRLQIYRIRSDKKSDGKSNKKIGNTYLKWATRTAAMVSRRESDQVKRYVDRLSRKYNKGKALGIYTHNLGRAVNFT